MRRKSLTLFAQVYNEDCNFYKDGLSEPRLRRRYKCIKLTVIVNNVYLFYVLWS